MSWHPESRKDFLLNDLPGFVACLALIAGGVYGTWNVPELSDAFGISDATMGRIAGYTSAGALVGAVAYGLFGIAHLTDRK